MNDNWKVSIVRDRETENRWIATAKREDFEFTQAVMGNEGEITAFCKTARTMFKQHVADKERAAALAAHFDATLEKEDEREQFEAQKAAEEKAASEAKRKADEEAAANAAELERKNAELKAKLEADEKAKADKNAEESPEPVEPQTPNLEGSNEPSV